MDKCSTKEKNDEGRREVVEQEETKKGRRKKGSVPLIPLPYFLPPWPLFMDEKKSIAVFFFFLRIPSVHIPPLLNKKTHGCIASLLYVWYNWGGGVYSQ